MKYIKVTQHYQKKNCNISPVVTNFAEDGAVAVLCRGRPKICNFALGTEKEGLKI